MEQFLENLKSRLATSWSSLDEWWRDSAVVIAPEGYSPVLDVGGFLTILAFSLAVFTLEQPKYRLRQAMALLPIKNVLFWTLVVFGSFTFLIETAIRFGWSLPWPIDPNTINLFLAGWVALLAIYWMLICFLRPPRYGRWTARRFFEESFRGIVNGTEDEMLTLARELSRELDRIIVNCPTFNARRPGDERQEIHLTNLQNYTYQIFGLLEDLRFCEIVAREVPSFPAKLVERLVEMKRFDTPAPNIIRRIVVAMLSNKRSALFVENERLSRGFMGQAKPITRSIFRNWSKFEISGYRCNSPLDLSYPQAREWDAEVWRIYFEMARQYLAGIEISHGSLESRSGVREILRTMEVAYQNYGETNAKYAYTDPNNPRRHIFEVNEFLHDLVKAADERSEWTHFDRQDNYSYGNDFSSQVAKMLEEALTYISWLESDEFFFLWDAQHNDFWNVLQDHKIKGSPNMRMIRRKLRRMIWHEIKMMDQFANYKGARYVRFCLFVMGFYSGNERKDPLDRDSWPLAKVVTDWVRRNYQDIAITHPPVAAAMLPFGFRYDAENGLLVRERGDTLTGKSHTTEFKLDPPKNATIT